MREENYEYHALKTMPIIFNNMQIKRKSFAHLHWHENVEVLLFYEGITEVLVDDQIYTAEEGDIIVVNSSVLHCTRAISDVAKYYVLIVDKDFCEQLGFLVEDQLVRAHFKDGRLFELVRELEKELEAKENYYYAAVISKVIEVLLILYKDFPAESTSNITNKNMEMIKTAIRYIKNNFTRPITVDDIADSTGYSKFYFCRCFKEITKVTVNSYLNQVRVNYAYKLICEKKEPVYIVAAKCGFSDPSYFSKIFKKYFSISPSQLTS